MDIPPKHGDCSLPHVYDRAFLLHGAKRNEVLTPAEVQQYGLSTVSWMPTTSACTECGLRNGTVAAYEFLAEQRLNVLVTHSARRRCMRSKRSSIGVTCASMT